MSGPLWQPSPERVARARIRTLMESTGHRDFRALHRWSVEEPEAFWGEVWSLSGILAETRGERVLVDGDRMPGARFFPDARLSFAENLLRREASGPAIVFRNEAGHRREVSRAELAREVARLRAALAAWGVGPGDRVAGFLPNLPEAVTAMLAATSLGAIWSSCSPDFGTQGVVDRFGQIEPKVLFAADGYVYGGKRFDCLARAGEIRARVPSIERLVVVAYAPGDGTADLPDGAVALGDLPAAPGEPGALPRFPFSHPLYVLYSSGTTGPPKCIVHSAGGTLLQHLKEHQLHVDLRPGERFFYFTTCGWMMWNWLVSGLASEATLVLFDGSPFHPGANALFDLAAEEGVEVFGTSAKFLDAAAKAGVLPARTHDLGRLRTILSTGSPLSPEGFDWVYENVKRDVHLASISGGTDIVSCFVLGNPVEPVWRGEIQGPGLGMAVDVFDEAGRALRAGKGELVCTRPFPSMPLRFAGDPDGLRYRAAYFERYPGVWAHGDFAEWTGHGGVIIHGRSDATLNPGGVRIGTAEIYRQVEQVDEVLESLAIGQAWDGDTRIVLFVKLREGVSLDGALERRIRARIRAGASPRHVPARIVAVADIPRTKSGKIVELAVRDVVHGRPVPNREALANPEALELFANLPELRE